MLSMRLFSGANLRKNGRHFLHHVAAEERADELELELTSRPFLLRQKSFVIAMI